MLPALLTTVLFSFSAVAASRTSRALGGMEANFWRLLLATLFLAALANIFGRGMEGPAAGIFFLSGLIGFGIGDVALYQAFPRIGSRLSIMLVHCLAAPFAAGVEWRWLGVRVSGWEGLCGVITLGGVCLALAPGSHDHIPRRTLVFGVWMGVIAALCNGIGAVLSRKAYLIASEAAFEMDGITAAYQRIWGGVLVAALAIAWRKTRPRPNVMQKNWREILPWLLINATAGPVFGVACYQWALGSAPTGIVLPIVALTPLTIIPLSWRLEGERPSLRSILGGVTAVAGVIGLTLTRLS